MFESLLRVVAETRLLWESFEHLRRLISRGNAIQLIEYPSALDYEAFLFVKADWSKDQGYSFQYRLSLSYRNSLKIENGASSSGGSRVLIASVAVGWRATVRRSPPAEARGSSPEVDSASYAA